MDTIDIITGGMKPDYDLAARLATAVAENILDQPMLLCWNDRDRDRHSPGGVMCEIKGQPGWEVFGETRGGQLRVSINKDDYVFIYC